MIVDLYILLASDAMVTGVLARGHETICFVSLGLGALVLLLRIFFGRTCCHPGGQVWVWRSRSPLRGYCFGAVVPWFLATFSRLCGWRSGSWVARSLLSWTYHCFRLGDWSSDHASSSVAFPWVGPVGGSCMSPHF